MQRKIIFALSLLLAFILGVMVTSAFAVNRPGDMMPAGEDPGRDAVPSTLPTTGALPGADPAEEIVIGVYEKVAPSVVHITAVRQTFNLFFGAVPQEGTGSGTIISTEGYILTNNHVIKGAETVTVTFFDGSFEDAQVVGTDPFTDLAILKVDKDIDPSWIAELGDSDALRVGQRAIAIGNPFGFDQTLSVGVISALGRPIKTPEAEYDDMIQTDASINPGNSGGPLINSSGQVIGVNTSIFSRTGTSLGIGFAIPANSCRKVAEDIIQYGRVRRPYLGVTVFALQPRISQELGISVNNGLLVQTVTAGSPAAKAGLKAGAESTMLRYGRYIFELILGGDIIVAIDDENMFTQQQLEQKIKKMSPGDVIKVTILRGMQTLDIEVELEIEP